MEDRIIITREQLAANHARAYQAGFEIGELIGELNVRFEVEREVHKFQMKMIDSITNEQNKCHTNQNT